MQSVVLTELGIAIWQNGRCVKSFEFEDPVSEYLAIKNREARLGRLEEFLSENPEGFAISDGALLDILKKRSLDVQMMSESEIQKIQETKPQVLVDAGFASDAQQAMTGLRDFAIKLSSAKVAEVSQSPDLHVIHAVNTLDETDKMINAVSARLREWYGLHFPELDNMIDSIVGYASIVLAGRREDLNERVFADAGFPDSKVEMLSLVCKKSVGGDISDQNLAAVQGLARQISGLYDLRRDMEEHVAKQMRDIAPNLSAVLGTAVAARMLGRAGSLKKLASMPASTIQVLGAEKALFRSLKTGSQPPKHGLLFQHALVHAAPRWQRGKIARVIAAKTAIAARVDIHGGELNQTLLEKLNLRVDEIGKKYDKPPEKPQVQPRDRPRHRGRAKGQKHSRRRKRFARR